LPVANTVETALGGGLAGVLAVDQGDVQFLIFDAQADQIGCLAAAVVDEQVEFVEVLKVSCHVVLDVVGPVFGTLGFDTEIDSSPVQHRQALPVEGVAVVAGFEEFDLGGDHAVAFQEQRRLVVVDPLLQRCRGPGGLDGGVLLDRGVGKTGVAEVRAVSRSGRRGLT
jgi:hypothetical protein